MAVCALFDGYYHCVTALDTSVISSIPKDTLYDHTSYIMHGQLHGTRNVGPKSCLFSVSTFVPNLFNSLPPPSSVANR